VSNLAKPDFLLAIIAGASTAAMMFLNPDLPEQMRALLIVVPALLALWAALQFGSALAIYWTTSNCFSMLQTAVTRRVIEKRIRSGVIQI
jgi:membrane protein insertase Oxa1/YidC/SpoIIIJ